MSKVYIEGFKMPKSCGECRYADFGYRNGNLFRCEIDGILKVSNMCHLERIDCDLREVE